MKCQPGCVCGRHAPRKNFCSPGCECGRHIKTEAARRNIAAAARQRDPSWAEQTRISRLGKRTKTVPSAGLYITSAGGYRMLTGQIHPLARGGEVMEHRKVLYDNIGPGPHECHWNDRFGCGKTELSWWGQGLVVDHLDENKLNNNLENLVPSCNMCNLHRSNPYTLGASCV